MIYPNRDKATGKDIPNSYIIGWEYSTNDDFQDVVCRVDNVVLIVDKPRPGDAEVDGSHGRLAYAAGHGFLGCLRRLRDRATATGAAGDAAAKQLIDRVAQVGRLEARPWPAERDRLAHLLEVVGDDRPDGDVGDEFQGLVKYSAARSGEPDSR